MSAKKKYMTINCKHLTQKHVRFCLPLPISVPLSSQSVPASSSHLLPTFPPSSLPFHNISSPVPSTALDVRHFLKPSTVTCCHAVTIHTDYIIHLYFLVHKLNRTCEGDSQFSPQMVLSGVKNFKYMCSGFLCCVCGLISLSSWLFLWFLISGSGQVLLLSLVAKF